MDLQRFGEIVWHSLLGIVLLTIVAGAAAFGLSGALPKQWEAESRLLVGSLVETDTSQLEAYQQLASTYAEVATSTPIMQRVIQRLSLPDDPKKLAERVTIRAAIGQAVVKIDATANDPNAAADLANAFASEIVALGQPTRIGSPSLVTVYQPGEPPEDPSSPKVLINTVIAASVGLVVGVGLALLITLAQEARGRRKPAAAGLTAAADGSQMQSRSNLPRLAVSSDLPRIAVTAVAPMPSTPEPWALYPSLDPTGMPPVRDSAAQSESAPAATTNGAHAAVREPTAIVVSPDKATAQPGETRNPRYQANPTDDPVPAPTSASDANSQGITPSSRAPTLSGSNAAPSHVTDLDMASPAPTTGADGIVPSKPARDRKTPSAVPTVTKKRRSAVQR